MLKKIFISRPMNGVTKEDDNKLLKEIREALFKEHVIGNFVCGEVINSWDSLIVAKCIPEDLTRVLKLGQAVSEMAEADVLIFVDGSFGDRECYIEFEVYNMYKDIMQEYWGEALVYNPNEKTLTPLSKCSGRYPWGAGKNRCVDVSADLIAELTCHGYPREFIEDAVKLSKKILDVGRTNM